MVQASTLVEHLQIPFEASQKGAVEEPTHDEDLPHLQTPPTLVSSGLAQGGSYSHLPSKQICPRLQDSTSDEHLHFPSFESQKGEVNEPRQVNPFPHLQSPLASSNNSPALHSEIGIVTHIA